MIRIIFAMGIAFFISGTAFADILEVRGKGLMNGKIVSQSGEGVVFQSNDGQIIKIAKSDVLFMDIEAVSDKKTEAASKSKISLGRIVKNWFSDLPGAWRKLRFQTSRWTQKFREVAGKPLDRSGVDRRAKELADALDDATKSQAVLSKKVKIVNAEGRRQQDEARDVAHKDKKSGFSGTFGKL